MWEYGVKPETVKHNDTGQSNLPVTHTATIYFNNGMKCSWNIFSTKDKTDPFDYWGDLIEWWKNPKLKSHYVINVKQSDGTNGISVISRDSIVCIDVDVRV